MIVIAESYISLDNDAVLLHIDIVVAVYHDFSYRRVVQE